MNNERVAVFIDSANVFHGLIEDFNKINIDYELLVNKLVGDRKLMHCYFYAVLPDQKTRAVQYSKQQRFLDKIEDLPYFSVKLGRLHRHGTNYVEKGVDVSLAVDMLELAFNQAFDTAILMSGDSDMVRVVQILQRLGKHVENAGTKKCLSKYLRKTCDIYHTFDDDFLNDCWR